MNRLSILLLLISLLFMTLVAEWVKSPKVYLRPDVAAWLPAQVQPAPAPTDPPAVDDHHLPRSAN